MNSLPSALVFLLMIFAGWVNRQQVIVIECLKAENGLLRKPSKPSPVVVATKSPSAVPSVFDTRIVTQ
jgi:hypothetical protein